MGAWEWWQGGKVLMHDGAHLAQGSTLPGRKRQATISRDEMWDGGRAMGLVTRLLGGPHQSLLVPPGWDGMQVQVWV